MKNRKFLAVISLFVFALLLSASCALAAEKVLKIGVLFPLTGPCATAGQRCVAAVETAAEVISTTSTPNWMSSWRSRKGS